jgi:protein CpxP
MKLLSSRTLLAAALATAVAGVSATALTSQPGTPDSMAGHMAQHMSQRTHIAPEVMQLAQATQAVTPTPTTQATPAATAEVAQPKPGHHAQRMERGERGDRMERMQARRAAHQERLKTRLQLTPAQEPAWLAFVARMQPEKGARVQRERTQSEGTKWSELTTPQRLDLMQARMAEREAAMGKRFEAIKSFYATLNSSQQKVFDGERIMGLQRTGMKGMKGMHHGKDHPHNQHRRGHDRHGMGVNAQPQS